MSNYRYVASHYYPESNQAANEAAPVSVATARDVSAHQYQGQQINVAYSPARQYFQAQQQVPVAQVVRQAPVAAPVEEVYKPPVYSSYAGYDDVPPCYTNQYTMVSPVAPSPVNFASELSSTQCSTHNSAQIPASYCLKSAVDNELHTPIVEQVVPRDYFASPAQRSAMRTVNAYAPLNDSSMYVFEKPDISQDEASFTKFVVENEPSSHHEVPVAPAPTMLLSGSATIQAPVATPYVDLEESVYLGFKSDVTAAYGKKLVPPSYETPVRMQKPVEYAPTPEVNYETAVQHTPVAARTRFQPAVQLQFPSENTVPEEQSLAESSLASPNGRAFAPSDNAEIVSHYHYDNLNDLVSCVKATY